MTYKVIQHQKLNKQSFVWKRDSYRVWWEEVNSSVYNSLNKDTHKGTYKEQVLRLSDLKQDKSLLTEMIHAFNLRLIGEYPTKEIANNVRLKIDNSNKSFFCEIIEC